MSDWGKGATSKKHEAAPERKWRMKSLVCSKCGQFWMFRYMYDSDLRQVRDEFGNVLCKNCRSKLPKRTPTPPSPEQRAAVQMTLDDIINAKK